MNTNIFGCSTAQRDDWHNEFSAVYEDEQECVILESKETFTHEDSAPFNFRYKYYVEAQRTEDGKWYYCLYFIPCIEYMCESIRESIYRSCGSFGGATTLDAYYYGAYVIFGNEQRGNGDECDYSVFDEIATVYRTLDDKRWYELDKPQTKLGSTGWDKLEHILTGKDEFARVFAEYKKQKNNGR